MRACEPMRTRPDDLWGRSSTKPSPCYFAAKPRAQRPPARLRDSRRPATLDFPRRSAAGRQETSMPERLPQPHATSPADTFRFYRATRATRTAAAARAERFRRVAEAAALDASVARDAGDAARALRAAGRAIRADARAREAQHVAMLSPRWAVGDDATRVATLSESMTEENQAIRRRAGSAAAGSATAAFRATQAARAVRAAPASDCRSTVRVQRAPHRGTARRVSRRSHVRRVRSAAAASAGDGPPPHEPPGPRAHDLLTGGGS